MSFCLLLQTETALSLSSASSGAEERTASRHVSEQSSACNHLLHSSCPGSARAVSPSVVWKSGRPLIVAAAYLNIVPDLLQGCRQSRAGEMPCWTSWPAAPFVCFGSRDCREQKRFLTGQDRPWWPGRRVWKRPGLNDFRCLGQTSRWPARRAKPAQ